MDQAFRQKQRQMKLNFRYHIYALWKVAKERESRIHVRRAQSE